MLNDARRLIKRTEFWLHRTVGTKSLKFDTYNNSQVKRIRLCGNSAFDANSFKETSMLTSADGKEHYIDVRLGSRNLLNYNTILDLMKEKITDAKISGNGNIITMTTKVNVDFALPLIEEDLVKFKENCVYTFTGKISYASGSGDKPTGFCFFYTDGTYEEIRINAGSSSLNPIKAVSRADKTLAALGMMKPEGNSRVYYHKTFFGLYEGDLSSLSSLNEPYVEPQYVRIPLDAPLRDIYGASDILDITEGVYQRNVEYLFFDSAQPFEETETPHVFLTRLPTKMRDDFMYECPHGVPSDDDESSNYAWVKICDDRESMLLYLPDCLTLDDANAYLSEEPFGLIYAMQDPIVKHFSVRFDDVEELVYMSLEVKYDPYLFYAEYI